MKKIRARFASRCAETGDRITKGQEMVYDYSTKKCYCMESRKAHNFLAGNIDPAAGMIQANEDAYFDNFCQQNNI